MEQSKPFVARQIGKIREIVLTKQRAYRNVLPPPPKFFKSIKILKHFTSGGVLRRDGRDGRDSRDSRDGREMRDSSGRGGRGGDGYGRGGDGYGRGGDGYGRDRAVDFVRDGMRDGDRSRERNRDRERDRGGYGPARRDREENHRHREYGRRYNPY